jgi:hypothetical protein
MISNVLLIVWMAAMAPEEGAGEGRDAAIALARQTLQQKVDAAASAIEVEEATAVDWPDGSLGCPKKGMAYMQMIVPGYRVRLRAGGQSYDVHVGGGRAVMCSEPAAGRKADSYVARAAPLAAEARRDLARRLATSESKIEVKRVRPTTWPDAELGCDGAQETPADAGTKGFLVELEHEGRTYEYHTDMSRVRLCE